MLFLFGKTLSTSKRIFNVLTNIYGISKKIATNICLNIGINPITKINKLNSKQINKLVYYIDKNILIEQDLKKKKNIYIQNLLNIKSYRGIRLFKKLPVNGQRTHTNAKTIKKLNLYD